MPAGVETSPEVVAEFRAHYLYSGNAAESARAVNLPERTGRDIARMLVDDDDFAEDRRMLRKSALEELVAKRMRVAQIALERFESETGGIDVKSFGGEDATTVITDKRGDYGKLVLDAEKNAHNLAKFEAEKNGELPPPGEVRIVVSATSSEQARVAAEAAPDAEQGD